LIADVASARSNQGAVQTILLNLQSSNFAFNFRDLRLKDVFE